MNQNNNREVAKRELAETKPFSAVESQQSEQMQHPLPPCHCESCSTIFWFFKEEQGSIHLIDPARAIVNMRDWAHNTVQKSSRIASIIRQHGRVLHKRWAEKCNSPKGQSLKLLENTLTSLTVCSKWQESLADLSLFVQNPGRDFSLHDAHNLCNEYFDQAIAELTLLREMPKTFVDRIKISLDFQKATASCDFLVGYHVLTKPHERVL